MSMINREALIRDAEREGKLRKDKWDTESVVNLIKGAMFVRERNMKWIDARENPPKQILADCAVIVQPKGNRNKFLSIDTYANGNWSRYFNEEVLYYIILPNTPFEELNV